ncbi:MAG TPA: nitrite/sulfite reductase [Gaiellaceae bacterium]|nr:nitrite/sulfite reductase [Gaiellaceae bacterium]
MATVAKPAPDWELVLKRNPVERLKREKAPLGIREELPALIAAGYENVAEEDVVRLQWWGLYHDKPKVGTFMLRVKIPAGQISPARLRAVGEVSNLYGKGDGELSTRQNIQLHWLELARLPDVFAHLDAAGVTTAGGCGDTVRNITGCPVQGIDAGELFDASPVVEAAADLFYGNPDWANLPRKHKYSISACADRCNAPEINCVSLVGAIHEGREGFGVLVGGGLSSVPRIARDLGVFVPKEEANEILGAITSVWSEDLRYRVSRVKARLKFMVDDIGPEGIRERVEAKLGRALEDYSLPPVDGEPSHHLGVHPQRQEGLSYIGVPVHLGLISGDQLIAVADLAERYGGDVRITRQQNFVVTGVPDESVPEAVAELERIGFPLDVNPVRGNSIACTGEPHCNFSVAETKTRLGALIERLEERFGEQIAELRLHLDGCPHACAQHWVGDLGFQGTTARDEGGVRRQAYDIFVRGSLGPEPAIGRPLFRRVPSAQLDAAVEGLVAGWLDRREPGEGFVAFARRAGDDELGELAGIAPAKGRQREEADE